MHIEKQETGTLTARLKVKVAPEDYTPGVEKALKEQRRTASLPGFRPGQVPMGIIRKRIGKATLINEVERIVGEGLNDYIRSNSLRVLGQPLPSNEGFEQNDWDSPGEMQFAYDLGLAPDLEIDLAELKGIERAVVKVDDALLQREVEDMQRRYGQLSNVEVSGDKDMLLGDMIQLDAEGNIKEGGIMNRATISLEFLEDAATREALVGLKQGDEVKVDPHKVSKDHDDLARMLGVDHEAVHHLSGDFLFRVDEVKRMEPLAVGPELFERVYGKDEAADETAFREKVRAGLQQMFQRDSERIFKRTVMAELIKRSNVELPDGFLQRWIMETSKEPVTLETVQEGYDDYAKGLKRQLLEDRIVEKYGLEAKGEELDGFAKRYVADQFAQYGMPPPEDAELQRIAARMLGDREQIGRMRNAIVDQKLMVHFLTLLEPREKEVSYEDFVNLARTT
ncbi:MAG: hypothetical protein KDB88_08295 [Flavobacteriales bacterium]|nr:hypothetical protein [Flavobacteriales bacterium]